MFSRKTTASKPSLIFVLIAVYTIIKYANLVKNKEIEKTKIWIDIVLWIITVFELIYLENAFEAIISF